MKGGLDIKSNFKIRLHCKLNHTDIEQIFEELKFKILVTTNSIAVKKITNYLVLCLQLILTEARIEIKQVTYMK